VRRRFFLPLGTTAVVLAKFEDFTTATTSGNMFYCHVSNHEDKGMMGQFTVVR
jgi:blue copper oxidase